MMRLIKKSLVKDKSGFSEVDFLEYYLVRSIDSIRVAIALGFLLYGVFGILDIFMAPESKAGLWVIRFCVVMPLMATSYYLTYKRYFVRFSQVILFLVSLVVGLGIVAMLILTRKNELANKFYFCGLMLSIFFTHTGLRLKAILGALSSLFILVAYVMFAFFFRGMTPFDNVILTINDLFFLIAAMSFGMMVSFFTERLFYKTYVQERSIRNEKQKLEGANQQINDLSLVKSKLIAIISHDMRAPLNSVKGMLELYKLNFLKEEEFRRSVPQLISSVSNAGLLLENLLQWSVSQMENRKENKKFFLFRTLVENVFALFRLQAEKNSVRLINSIDKGLTGFGNPIEIELVIRNLVGNSIRFTQNGQVEVSGRELNDMIEITVRDNGIGIPKQLKENLFSWNINSHKDESEQEKGMGIGLSICKELIERNSGSLFYSSSEKSGTSFYFTLPYAKANKEGLDVTHPIRNSG